MALSYITQGSIFLCPRTYCYWDTAATASKHNQNKKIELQVQKKNLKNNNQHRTEIPHSKKKATVCENIAHARQNSWIKGITFVSKH